jgi:hypothetical protein
VLDAPHGQMAKPNSIRYTISGGAIDCDNENTAGLDKRKVWARAGGRVVFTIQNHDDVDYRVRIPIDEVRPRHDGPAEPLDRHPDYTEMAVVPKRDMAVIVLKVKHQQHFPFGPQASAFTYKYNVYWADVSNGTPEEQLDPDLEIST